MSKRLLQAAIITFSIQMLASISSPTTLQTSSAYRLRSNPTAYPCANSDSAASAVSVAENIVKVKDRELCDRDILKQNKKISNNFL